MEENEIVNQIKKKELKSNLKIINKENINSYLNENELELLKSQLCFNLDFTNFHPDRKNEFILSRVCAHLSIYELTNELQYDFFKNEDRSPRWPLHLVGSLSHNQLGLATAISFKKDLLGVGIDLETRKRVNSKIASHIMTPYDLKSYASWAEADLYSLIFSAKESLFKAIYPLVNKFFGFEYAAVTSIDINKSTFNIKLIKEIESQYKIAVPSDYLGHFVFTDNYCFTIIEIGY
jgi:enterobactin synthetase component D